MAREDCLEQRFVHSAQRRGNGLVDVQLRTHQADVHAGRDAPQNAFDLGKRERAGLRAFTVRSRTAMRIPGTGTNGYARSIHGIICAAYDPDHVCGNLSHPVVPMWSKIAL